MMQPSASAHCVIVPCMSLCQCSSVCGHHSIFYVCFTCYYGCHWKMGEREHERKREAMQHKLPLVTCRYHQNRRIKIKKQKKATLPVARLLLPTSKLLVPSTVFIWKQKELITGVTRTEIEALRPTRPHYHHHQRHTNTHSRLLTHIRQKGSLQWWV